MRTASEVVRSLEARIARLEQSKVAGGGLSSASGYPKFVKGKMSWFEHTIQWHLKNKKLGTPILWSIDSDHNGDTIYVTVESGEVYGFPVRVGEDANGFDCIKILTPRDSMGKTLW
jgi:hypothetical protein